MSPFRVHASTGRLCIAAWLVVLAALPSQAALAPESPVLLVVNSDSTELTFARVSEALASSLGAPVVEASSAAGTEAEVRRMVTVTWRPSRRELAVTYQDGRRGTMSRVVPSPEAAEEALQVATALATNLVRNEADELLGPEAPLASAPPMPPPPLAPVTRAAPPVELHTPAAPAPPPRPHATVVGSLFFPLATNYRAPEIRTQLSVNFFYGRVGQLDGLQVGFGANAVDGPVLGAQMGLGFNLAGGPVSGFQAAMGLNYAEGPVHGFQGALGLNRSAGGRGLQFAFGLNSSGGPWSGLQAAPVNVAQDLRGMQVGLVNVAGRVRGVQLGLINIAEDVEGIPIGLISVTRSGGVHPVFWSSSETVASVGLKFSTRYTYTLLSGAARREGEQNLFGPGMALGVRIPFLPGYFESDVGASFLFGGPLCCVDAKVGLADDLLLGRWRSLIGFELHRRFSLFVGAALAGLGRFHEPTDERTIELRPELFAGVQL